MLRLTLKGVRGHLGRFLLTLSAVTLGIAFVAGSFVLTDSLQSTFDDLIESMAEGVDVTVRSDRDANVTSDAAQPRLPLDLERSLAGVDGVTRAVPDLQGVAVLAGKDGTAVRAGGAPSIGYAYFPDDPAIELLDGRAPQGPNEVAVLTSTLDRARLAVGDTTTALIGSTPRTVTIVGEVSFDGPTAGATLTLLDRESATKAFSPDGLVPSFSVTAAPGVSPETLRDRLGAVLPAGAEAVTTKDAAEEMRKEIEDALGFVTTFLLVFAGISLFVGAFIIFNTFTMLVGQRTRELALLRAIGALRAQVLRMVLGEALVIGLIGAGLGLGLGVGLAGGLQGMLQSFGMEASGDLPVETRTVIISLVVGMLVTTISAAIPAARASRAAPVEGLRDDIVVTPKGVRVRGVIGLVKAAAGVAVLAVGLRDGTEWLLVGAGAILIVLGVLVAAPLATRPVVRLVAAPFVLLTGVVGRLARENSLRNPRRTAATATALTIGLTLMAGLSVIAESTKASVADIVANEVTADFVLESGGMVPIPPAVATEVERMTGVTAVAAISQVDLSMDGTDVWAASADPEDITSTVRVTMRSGSLRSLDDGRVLVNETLAEDNGWTLGSTVPTKVGVLDSRPLTIGGIFKDSQLVGEALVPQPLYEEAVPLPNRGSVAMLITAKDGADLAAMRADLAALVKPFLVVSVQTGEEFVDGEAAEVNQILTILYVLLALSIVIAVLGIINTLALSVLERTREIGLLRAVGLARGQLFRMITIESVATALFGAVLGAVLGLGLGIVLQRGLVEDGLEVLSIPWSQLSIVVAGAAVAGIVAAVLPAWRAVRLDVLRAVTTE